MSFAFIPAHSSYLSSSAFSGQLLSGLAPNSTLTRTHDYHVRVRTSLPPQPHPVYPQPFHTGFSSIIMTTTSSSGEYTTTSSSGEYTTTNPTTTGKVKSPSTTPPKFDFDFNAWLYAYRSAVDETSSFLYKDNQPPPASPSSSSSSPTTKSPGLQITKGKLPADLKGTLYSVGPACFQVGDMKIAHPWDGDGMISALTFFPNNVEGPDHTQNQAQDPKEEDKETDLLAWFRNRFVRTEGYMKEQVARQRIRKISYRGVFGTQLPGGPLANMFYLKTKNVANISPMVWADRLLVGWDGGLPHLLDPKSLTTLGMTSLHPDTPPNSGVLAHTHVDPHTQQLVTARFPGIVGGAMTFEEFNQDFKRVSIRTIDLPGGYSLIHDFMITPNYYIIIKPSVQIKPLSFVFGFKSLAECMSYDPQMPATVYLIPRKDSWAPVKVANMSPCHIYHHINAYEVPDKDQVVFQVCKAPNLSFYGFIENPTQFQELYAPMRPYTITIDAVSTKQPVIRQETLISNTVSEFYTINHTYYTQKHKFMYGLVTSTGTNDSPLHGIQKINVETGEIQSYNPGPTRFCMEPTFVPKKNAKGEDDGYIITMIADGASDTNYYHILDAKNIAAGPVCEIRLNCHIPYQLHSVWTDQVTTRKGAKTTSLHEIFSSKGWNKVSSKFSGLGL